MDNNVQRNERERQDSKKIQSFCISGALVYVLRFPGHPQDQKAFSDLRTWLEKGKTVQKLKYWSCTLKPEPSENRILHIFLANTITTLPDSHNLGLFFYLFSEHDLKRRHLCVCYTQTEHRVDISTLGIIQKKWEFHCKIHKLSCFIYQLIKGFKRPNWWVEKESGSLQKPRAYCRSHRSAVINKKRWTDSLRRSAAAAGPR